MNAEGKLVGLLTLDDVLAQFASKFAQMGELLQRESPADLARTDRVFGMRRVMAWPRTFLQVIRHKETANGYSHEAQCRAGLDEQTAFHRLQKLASDRNRKLVDVAQVILMAEEALQPQGV